MAHDSGDWAPTCSIETLRRRARLVQCLRHFFCERDFLEVDTPLLSHDIVVDAHIEPISVPVSGTTMYLQTSPEAAMKRLLAAGSGSLFQLTRSFRAGERGSLHNVEFMMLEWYDVGASWTDQLEMTESLIRASTACFSGSSPVTLASSPFAVTTYQQAFERELKIDVLSTTDSELRACAAKHLAEVTLPADRDDLLNLLLASEIEPQLGTDSPEFLVDYPISQAALSERSTDDPRVARRFELYINGIELCNGYQELTDPAEMRAREFTQVDERSRNHSLELPGAGRMLAAMESGLPACSGVALGVDRLLMLLTGASCIDECIPFPIERA